MATPKRELLDHVADWPDIETGQAAVDVFRARYNTNRRHQSLDMALPADRTVPGSSNVTVGGQGPKCRPSLAGRR